MVILLSLGAVLNVPALAGAPTLENLIPRHFEVNAMLVGSEGDVAAGSFYAMDPSVVPWDLSKDIYRNVGVTVIASNLNASTLSDLLGINIPSAIIRMLPVKVLIVIHGPQRNAPAIASDIENVFGMTAGSFTALASNPLTLPVSVFGANLSPAGYSAFVTRFSEKTSNKPVVIGRYTPSLLESSPSALFFTSVVSLALPLGGLIPVSASGYASILSSTYGLPFGVNSTGVLLVRPNLLDFSQPQDHSLTFGNVVGFGTGLTSTTNETFVTVLPGGAAVNSFTPSNMVVQSTPQSGGPQFTVVFGFLPWVGTVQRLLPDVTVNFHYPAFNGPALDLDWTATPFNVAGTFTLSLTLHNRGALDARKLTVWLGLGGVRNAVGPPEGTIVYTINSLPAGASNTTTFNLVSYASIAAFTVSATFKDPQDFAYTWARVFSVAANVRDNGPLTVQKTVTPSNPAYGEVGNVTVTIFNPSSTQTFYNLVVLTPEAIPYLYPTGIGYTPAEPLPCPYLSSVYANSTHFTLSAYNYCDAPAVLTSIRVQPGSGSLMQLVDQVRTPLSGSWSPLYPYRYPGNANLTGGEYVSVQLDFENLAPVSNYGYAYYYSLPDLGSDPRASYLSLGCSPCNISQGNTTTISGLLANATGDPVSGATVRLSYWNQIDRVSRPLATVTTVNGAYSYSWTPSDPGSYTVEADFDGSVSLDPTAAQRNVRVLTPTTIGPLQTITLSYSYFFNTTGTITISPERVAYSSIERLPSTGDFVIGEYVAASNAVPPVVVGDPVIFPILETTMNATRFDSLYLARNQTDVRITLRLRNSGQQPADNLQMVSLIPRQVFCYYYCPPPLPVVPGSASPGLTVNITGGYVSLSVASLQPGQEVIESYVVRATGPYSVAHSSYANVTAESGGRLFKFIWDAPLLAVYPDFTIQPPLDRGFIEVFTTVDPPLVANGTSTTLTVHMFNMGNVTYNSINVTMPDGPYSDFTSATRTQVIPSLAPGAYQSLSFVLTARANVTFYYGETLSSSIYYNVSYNRTSTIGFSNQYYTPITIFNSRSGANPGFRITLSAPTTVSAGSTNYVVVTIANTGNSNITSITLNLRALSPIFSPDGPITPETSYGSYYLSWSSYLSPITPGETIKFRVGIMTRAGGTYPVFISYGYFSFSLSAPGFYGSGSILGSTGSVFTATDSTGPTVSVPWKSPFAPSSTDPVQVWAHVWDGSGIQQANLEYSTDNKQTWTSLSMTPLIGSYVSSDRILPVQSVFGDIYNAIIPSQASDATVYYRVRTIDRVGNSVVEDNGGIGYQYTVLGSKSTLIPVQPGQNVLLDLTQQIPTLRATITLNVTVPVEIQVTQLTANPGGTPPSGTSALGIFVTINANETIALDARIRLYYDDSQVQNLNESTVAPYFWNGLQWVALEDVTRNTADNWVEGTVHHLSLFGIFASQPVSTQPPTTPADNTWLLVVAGSIVAVVAIASSILFLRRRRRPETATTLGAPQSPPTTPTPP